MTLILLSDIGHIYSTFKGDKETVHIERGRNTYALTPAQFKMLTRDGKIYLDED